MSKKYDLNEYFEDDPYETEPDSVLILDDSDLKLPNFKEIIQKAMKE